MNRLEEVYFWAGILRDHAEFQLLTFSYRESRDIAKAKYFKDAFIAFRKKAEIQLRNPNKRDTSNFVDQFLYIVTEFIEFKKSLLQKLLTCNIELGLTPSFINHMINEALECKRELSKDKACTDMTMENIKLHLIWLPDAAGHAAAIIGDTDYVEKEWIEISQEFEKTFLDLFVKATELGMMLERTGLKNGALELLNEEVCKHIEDFNVYLCKVKELREACKLLGVIKPIMLDHMLREEKYYVSKIKEYMCK
ncbi:DUF2935 family protein [Natranaerovirga pectinivora]|uniref:DUF2935 family protein n=1 Tax=Natranaerovirga pectinivora TaxID=682400 RepID=A0A4R3MQ68_9FIRM|nr:DUF2935 domain-containing protein [Natranaerovirga pectinivora]TCT15311.1 DUF2935 family protein [Natranaerovirga pectinivora]